MPFFLQENSIFRTYFEHQLHLSIALQDTGYSEVHPPTPEQVCAFLRLVGYYPKFIKNFTKIAKLLTLLTRQQVKFEWTPAHHEAFLKLNNFIIQAQILHYPNPNRRYIVNMDASDDACRA